MVIIPVKLVDDEEIGMFDANLRFDRYGKQPGQEGLMCEVSILVFYFLSS